MKESLINDEWLSGFILGQNVYQTGSGDKEMLISIPQESNIIKDLEQLFNESSYNKGKRNIIKLKSAKIKEIKNQFNIKSGADFIVGLMESNFDTFTERKMELNKVLSSRQYIKLPNNFILRDILEKYNIKYNIATKTSIKITKKIDCEKFIKIFAPKRFKIYCKEIEKLREHIS